MTDSDRKLIQNYIMERVKLLGDDQLAAIAPFIGTLSDDAELEPEDRIKAMQCVGFIALEAMTQACLLANQELTSRRTKQSQLN